MMLSNESKAEFIVSILKDILKEKGAILYEKKVKSTD